MPEETAARKQARLMREYREALADDRGEDAGALFLEIEEHEYTDIQALDLIKRDREIAFAQSTGVSEDIIASMVAARKENAEAFASDPTILPEPKSLKGLREEWGKFKDDPLGYTVDKVEDGLNEAVDVVDDVVLGVGGAIAKPTTAVLDAVLGKPGKAVGGVADSVIRGAESEIIDPIFGFLVEDIVLEPAEAAVQAFHDGISHVLVNVLGFGDSGGGYTLSNPDDAFEHNYNDPLFRGSASYDATRAGLPLSTGLPNVTGQKLTLGEPLYRPTPGVASNRTRT